MIARLRASSLILAATTDSMSDHAFLLPHPILGEFHLSRWHPQNPSCLYKGSRADKELPWEEQWKGVHILFFTYYGWSSLLASDCSRTTVPEVCPIS